MSRALLKELILHACSLHVLIKDRRNGKRHLVASDPDQCETVQMVPSTTSKFVSIPRLLRIAQTLLGRLLAIARTLGELCRVIGASKRSVERLFQQEIGMTFRKWRQQLRLMQAMRLLAEGAKVTHAALESGYRTPSAFHFDVQEGPGAPRQLLTSGCDSPRLNTPSMAHAYSILNREGVEEVPVMTKEGSIEPQGLVHRFPRCPRLLLIVAMQRRAGYKSAAHGGGRGRFLTATGRVSEQKTGRVLQRAPILESARQE